MMTHLQNYLKVTWPSLTLSAAFTAGGVALVRETATKTKGIALTLLGAYMLMNHIAVYCNESKKRIKKQSQGINNQSFTQRMAMLAKISLTSVPRLVQKCFNPKTNAQTQK